MTVRAATQADAPQITALMNRVIRDTTVTFNSVEKTASDVATQIAEGRPYFVYDTGGAVKGYSTYGPFRAGIGYAHTVEYGIAIDPLAQGHGAGRALLAAVADHAKAAGRKIIVACISADNTDGINFHKAMGFEQTGHLPAVGHKFGRDLDLIFAQKRL